MIPLLTVAAQTLAIYAFLVACLVVGGRRQIAQITFVELIVIMVLGSAVETAMVAGNTSLLAGIVSATVLLLADRFLSLALTRWTWLRRHVLGGPVVLVHDGALVANHLRQVGLTADDVESAIRERGYSGSQAVRYAFLEIDGSVGVIPVDAPVHRQPGSTDPGDRTSKLGHRSKSGGRRKPPT